VKTTLSCLSAIGFEPVVCHNCQGPKTFDGQRAALAYQVQQGTESKLVFVDFVQA